MIILLITLLDFLKVQLNVYEYFKMGMPFKRMHKCSQHIGWVIRNSTKLECMEVLCNLNSEPWSCGASKYTLYSAEGYSHMVYIMPPLPINHGEFVHVKFQAGSTNKFINCDFINIKIVTIDKDSTITIVETWYNVNENTFHIMDPMYYILSIHIPGLHWYVLTMHQI